MSTSALDVRALGAGGPEEVQMSNRILTRVRADSRMHAAACGLAAAAGRRERCPGASCPLWETNRNAPAAGCAIEPIVPHLKSRPELVHYLLELRERLGVALL